MEQTYSKGDVILVKKLFNAYQTNDVVYLSYPLKESTFSGIRFFQRIFGMPGDSVSVIGKRIYVGNYEIQDTSTIKHNYLIQTNSYLPDTNFKLKYHLTEGGRISDEFDFSYSLTSAESLLLQKDSNIRSLSIKKEQIGSFDENCFPYTRHYSWNMDYYGKLYVPKKNDTLQLDTTKIHLYHELISNHEKNFLIVKRDSIFINGKFSSYYVVKQNYYFVVGDNRDNANDSRAWGFLPEKLIVGKVIGRLKKNN